MAMRLLDLLGVTVTVAFLTAGVVLWWRAKRFAFLHATAPAHETREIDPTADAPIGFGYKTVWLAVRSTSPTEVANAFALVSTQPCNWRSAIGVIYAGQGRAFVAPPIRGWVLVAGVDLPTFQDASLVPLLRTLGERFSDVQYFASHRVSSYYAWARVLSGRQVRTFEFAEELSQEGGEIDEAENRLREADRERWISDGFDVEEWAFTPNEDDVLAIAGAWGLDPSKIEEFGLPPSAGLAGALNRKNE